MFSNLKILLGSLVVSTLTTTVYAATCSVQCRHSLEKVILSADSHSDHGEFEVSCREMDGYPERAGSNLSCLKLESYSTTEFGYGTTNYEARVEANKACSSQSCDSRGPAPWCPRLIRYHSATPFGGSCN